MHRSSSFSTSASSSPQCTFLCSPLKDEDADVEKDEEACTATRSETGEITTSLFAQVYFRTPTRGKDLPMRMLRLNGEKDMVRLLLSFVIAGMVYELYWHLMSRWHGVHARWIGRSRAEQRLREHGAGFLRLLIVWALVLVVYAIGTESSGLTLNLASWGRSISAGEWGFITAMSPVLAAIEWYFTRQPEGQILGEEKSKLALESIIPTPLQSPQ